MGSEGAYNIIAYDNRYIGIPQAAGPLEVDKTDLATLPNVMVEDTYARLVSRLRKSIAETVGHAKTR